MNNSTARWCARSVPALALFLFTVGCETTRSASYFSDDDLAAECESVRPAGSARRPSVAEVIERARAEHMAERASAGEPQEEQHPQVERKVPPARTAQGEAVWAVGLGREWQWIVIHHSATERGSAAEFNKEHMARGWDGLGYHFVIGNGNGSGDGEIEIGYRWKQQLRGAHAGVAEYNEHGIGIVLVGNFNETRPTPRQMESLYKLLGFLMNYCRIPADNVVGHREIKITDCPGRNFDMNALRASLRSLQPADMEQPSNVGRSPSSARVATPRANTGRPSSASLPASRTVRVGGGAMLP